MPVVPTPQRRVQPQGLPAPRLSTNVPSAAVGVPSQGLDLSAVRDQAIRIATEEKDKANQIQLTEANGWLTAERTRIGAEMVSKKGKNAFDAIPKADEEYHQVAQSIQQSLGSDELKLAFSRMVASGWNQINEQGQYHVAAEREKYDTAATEFAVKAQQNNAISNYKNADIVENSILAQRVLLQAAAQRKGLSPEQAKDIQDNAISATRMGVLKGFVDTGEDVAAEAYFKAHATDFVGDDYLQAQHLQQEGSIEGQAQRQADAILLRTRTGPESMAEAAKMEPGRVREEVERRLRRHWDDQATFARRAEDEAFQEGGRLLERTHNYDAIPLTLRLQMNESQRNQLKAAEKRERNPERETKLSLWHHLNNLAHLNDATKQEFLRINLGEAQYMNGLSVTDWKHFDNLQTTMRGGGSDGTEKPDRSLMRREEAGIIKQAQDNLKRTEAIAGIVKRNPEAADLFPAPRPIIIEPWMADSASRSPSYARYLRQQGVPIDTKLFTPVPDSAVKRMQKDQQEIHPVPGAPIKSKADMMADALSESGLAGATARIKARAKP